MQPIATRFVQSPLHYFLLLGVRLTAYLALPCCLGLGHRLRWSSGDWRPLTTVATVVAALCSLGLVHNVSLVKVGKPVSQSINRLSQAILVYFVSVRSQTVGTNSASSASLVWTTPALARRSAERTVRLSLSRATATAAATAPAPAASASASASLATWATPAARAVSRTCRRLPLAALFLSACSLLVLTGVLLLGRYARINGACVFLPGSAVSCTDKVRNGNEEGVDCGGPQCAACGDGAATVFGFPLATIAIAGALASAVAAAGLVTVVVVARRKRAASRPSIVKYNVAARRSSDCDDLGAGASPQSFTMATSRSTRTGTGLIALHVPSGCVGGRCECACYLLALAPCVALTSARQHEQTGHFGSAGSLDATLDRQQGTLSLLVCCHRISLVVVMPLGGGRPCVTHNSIRTPGDSHRWSSKLGIGHAASR